MKTVITPALQELRAVLNEADEITKRTDITKRDESRLNFLLAKAKMLREGTDVSTPESRALDWFKHYHKTGESRVDPTLHPLKAGTQSISYSEGPEGGYTVPAEFSDKIYFGMSQNDPLLDANVVSIIKGGSPFRLRPFQIPGWDLSEYTSLQTSEGADRVPAAPPDVTGSTLNGFRYTCSLAVTLEHEEDSFISTMANLQKAFAIGQARGIGSAITSGSGSGDPQGVVTGATPSGITIASATVITGDEIENIYFALDRFYRSQPKCAWLMNDATYQKVRKAKDSANRPLLNIAEDRETLMGKPVYVCPSIMSTGERGIIFGDLSYFAVRVSDMWISRSMQENNYIEYGRALYTCHMRADSKVIDPTSGAKPPIISADLHS